MDREEGAEFCDRPTRRTYSPQGGQGRLASVRAQLLPALPAGGAPGGDGRDLDQPYRVPLYRAVERVGENPKGLRCEASSRSFGFLVWGRYWPGVCAPRASKLEDLSKDEADALLPALGQVSHVSLALLLTLMPISRQPIRVEGKRVILRAAQSSVVAA